MIKFLDNTGLAYFWEKIKSLFVKKDTFESSYAEMLEGKEVTASALNDLNSRIVDITSSPYTNITQSDINTWNNKISSIKSISDNSNTYSLVGSGVIYVGKINNIPLFSTDNIPFKTINNEQIIGSGNINIKTNITTIPIATSEIINNKIIYEVFIPIDISSNIYDGDELSNSSICPYISPQDKHFELGIGRIIKNKSIITDVKLIGTCLYDNLSVININNVLKMYTLLPFDNFLENLYGVLVKYYNISSNNDDYEVINIYENTDTLVESLWIDNYDIGLTLWFDDFYDKQELAEEYEYDNWEDYVEYITTNISMLNQENPFIYRGNTITWNGETYYMWIPNSDNIGLALILTDTIDRDELYNDSLEADPNNEWCPYIIKSTTSELYDYGIYESSDTNDILVKVSKISQSVLNIVQNYGGYDNCNDYETFIKDDIVYSPSDYSGIKKYDYREQIEWNNDTYYLWFISSESDDEVYQKYGILTSSRYARDLYPYSLEANPYCDEFPIVAFVDEDYNFDDDYDLEPYNENKIIKIEIE